ncbi:MAG TPA: dTDP-4-dehydrorhamnose 3,5-epimerase [Candidatus Dormibacteraeota bacterium]|nr:dTDP-4-dehydrorhamnose 3,5-epimerase [Candidatus Dormibacteraeota bacterium]
MHAQQLGIPHAIEFRPRTHPDRRGVFVNPFTDDSFREAVGHGLTVVQTNHSVSRRGVVRGMHFADVPPGQAKYVYCASGSLVDIVLDVRVGSPTFGKWEAVRLDSKDYHAVYVAEGLAHGVIALEDDTVLIYLCSTGYNPTAEHGVNPLDPALELPWREFLPRSAELILSEKDTDAPSLAEAEQSGLLPSYKECVSYYRRLREAEPTASGV